MNYESVTLQDCIDNFEKKGKTALIENGQVVEFRKED